MRLGAGEGGGREVRPICTGRGEACVRFVRGGERRASDSYWGGGHLVDNHLVEERAAVAPAASRGRCRELLPRPA